MKKKYLMLSLLFGMIFSLGLISLINLSYGTIQEADNYIWNENIIYENENDNGIMPDFQYNVRNKTYYTKDYPSHFDFRNEIGLINESISLISHVPHGYYAEVIPTLKGHDSVVNMTGNAGINKLNIEFSPYYETDYDLENIIEFWCYCPTNSVVNTITLFDDYRPCIIIYYHSSGYFYYIANGGALTPTTTKYYPNNWTHWSLKWYSDNDFHLYIDGYVVISKRDNYQTQVHGINRLGLYISLDSYLCLDAFGMDDCLKEPWYTPTDNYIPEIIITNDLEVDKNEFDYDYADFEKNLYEIVQTETTSNSNDVFLMSNNDIDNDLVFLQINDADYMSSLTYYPNITSNLVDVSTSFYINNMESNHQFTLTFLPYKATDSYKLKVENEHLWIYDVVGNNWKNIDDIYENIEYTLDIYFNFFDNFACVFLNGELTQAIWLIDGDTNYNSYGLNRISIYSSKHITDDEYTYIEIHNLGVYQNGTSVKSSDNNDKNYGLLSYTINYMTILTLESNLLDINILQDCSIYNYVNYLDFFFEGNQIYSRDNHSGLEIHNLVNFDNLYYRLIFIVYNNISYPTYIKSEGIYLKNENDVFLIQEYTYFHSEKDDNYFYVDNNHLHYKFNNSLEVNPEFMSISFYTIDYGIYENYSIGFNSYITNNYSCELQLNYYPISHTDYIINKSNSLKYSEYILEKDLLILSFVITVSVDSHDTANGISEGYIDTIKLGNSYNVFDDILDDIDDSLLDLEFIDAIVYVSIILIFFIIPCFLVYERYGRKVVIPMFLLIVIVLMISAFLPIWLSVILLISGFLFIYHKAKKGEFDD